MPSRPRTAEFSQRAALFGAKVRAGREARGLSQLQLAELVDISYRSLQLIETNRNNVKGSAEPQPANPKLDTVYLLAVALELDVAYLVDPGQPVRSGA